MAEKFIPYEKLSKKKQKERNAKQRGSFGLVKAYTQTHKTKKDYNRQNEKLKVRKGEFDD